MKLIKKEIISKTSNTFDLTISNNHNYIIDGGMVVSNCHGARADVAQKIVNESGKHIAFRYGVTGTFPKSEVDQLSLLGSIGEIHTTIPARWLIDQGYLAEVEIEPVAIKEKVPEDFPDYSAERAFLSKSPHRMEVIADLIIHYCETYGNTLVLVNSIPFGEKLAKMIEGAVFLSGSTEKEERRENYDLFEAQDDIIRIATSGIASTGISINRVFCMMLIDSGKSFIKAIQSVGRGTRLAHDKKKVHVVDVYSELRWSKKHFKERQKYYKEAEYILLPTTKIKL